MKETGELGLDGSKIMDIIDKDLRRSSNFLMESDYDIVKQILLNLALYVPEVSYYQGMNYICVYLYYTIEDKDKTFQFMAYLVENYLKEHYSNSLEGVMQLTYIADKLLEINDGIVWMKLLQARLNTVHFSISNYLTIFTSYIVKQHLYPFVDKIWDLFLADGYSAVTKSFLYLINYQQKEIINISPDTIFMDIKKLDSHPLGIALKEINLELKPCVEDLMLRSITKKKINLYPLNTDMYMYLSDYYSRVIKRLDSLSKNNG